MGTIDRARTDRELQKRAAHAVAAATGFKPVKPGELLQPTRLNPQRKRG